MSPVSGWGFVAAFAHLPGDADDELAVPACGRVRKSGVVVHIKTRLRDAVAVAQVDKGHTTKVAGNLHPAGEFLLANI